jgi:hypothetical protein
MRIGNQAVRLSYGDVTVSTGWSERAGGNRQTTTGLALRRDVRRFDPAPVGDANNLGIMQATNSVNHNCRLRRVCTADGRVSGLSGGYLRPGNRSRCNSAGVGVDDDTLQNLKYEPPAGSKVVKNPTIAEAAGGAVTTFLKLRVLESGIRIAGGSRHASWADSDEASTMRRMPGPSCGLRCRQSRGALLRARILSLPKLQVRCGGPTCTDPANALSYGIQPGHTMRNGSPSRLGLENRVPMPVHRSRSLIRNWCSRKANRSCGCNSATPIHSCQFRSKFNGSPSVVHRTAFHNPMPLREVLATPSSRMVSIQGRFQRAGVAVNGVL